MRLGKAWRELTSRRAVMSTENLGNYRFAPLRLGLIAAQPRQIALTVAVGGFVLFAYQHTLIAAARAGKCSGQLLIIIAFMTVCLIACVVLLLLTSITDPGIMTRETSPPPDAAAFFARNGRYPRSKPGTVLGKETHIWFCGTCLRWIPARGFHCRVCDVCIEIFDHHCVFTGSCVGRRNYGYFFYSTVSTALASILTVVAIILYLVDFATRTQSAGALSTFLGSLLAELGFGRLLGTIFTMSFGSLVVHHLSLLRLNVTNHEMLRGTWGPANENTESPYPRRDISAALKYTCEPRPASRIWGQPHTEEFEMESTF